jgi:CRISPR system Cascade subunit CasD
MDTLLIRLAAPMQAWGVQSHGENRDTALEPSKSGVIGLLCAALGRDRAYPLDDLCSLRMGTRVDREGRLQSDYQTIHAILPDGRINGPPNVSTRFYLAGAIFLVGLEGEWTLLNQLQEALKNPRWTLCLGRKAFPPAAPVWLQDGLRSEMKLENALNSYPWLLDDPLTKFMMKENTRKEDRPEWLRMIIDDPQGELVRLDVPISFTARTFRSRRVHMTRIPAPKPATTVRN